MMRPKIISLLTVMLCLFSYTGSTAQELSFENIGTDTGLPATEVYNIFQDSKGYLWAATEYGLVKYNGNHFLPGCTNIPLREQIIYAVFRNEKGQIFLANSLWQFYELRNDSAILLPGSAALAAASAKKHTVGSFFVDGAGNISVSSMSGTLEYTRSSNSVNIIKLPLDRDTLRQKIEVGKGWFRVRGGVPGMFDLSHPVYGGQYFFSQGSVAYRHSVIENRNGLYILLQNAVVRITANGKTKKYSIPGTSLTMSEAPDGHMLVGVLNEGLFEFNEDLVLLHHYLPRLTVTDILFDTSGGMWVSTLEQGIFHCRNIHEYYYNNFPEFAGHISMIRQVQGKLFIGTAAGTVMAVDTSMHIVSLRHNAFVRDIVYWLGAYIIGTRSGIYSFAPDLTSPVKRNIYCSYAFGLRNDSLLVSLNDAVGGVDKKMTVVVSPVHAPRINCIVWKDSATCYLGTEKGILLFRGNTTFCPDWLLPLHQSRVKRMVRDSTGSLWVCTTGDGLYVIKSDKTLQRVPAPAEILTDIGFLPDGKMLLSSNTGLFIQDAKHPDAPARRIWAGEVTQASCYRDKIYIGTKQGLVVLDSSVLSKPDDKLFVYLHDVSAKGKNIPADNMLLSYFQNDLYFTFDVLCYNGNRPAISYALSGAVPTEGVMTGTQIHLQNLDPGNYILRLYSGNNRKLLTTIPFFIKPAFWQTTWFKIVVTLTSVMLLVCVVWLIINSMKRREKRKATVRRLLSEYKLTALKAQINPHFISNSLTAIHQLVLCNETDKAGRYLAKFSLLIRYVLRYSDKSLALLADELKVIALNISLEQLRFRDHFIYEENIAPDIDVNALYIPPLITQPLIENAIWHGLLRLKNSRQPKLMLAVTRRGDSIVIIIEDNGVGRQATEKLQDPGNADRGASHGISLTRSRIHNLNQLYDDGKAAIVITDLFRGDEPAGTRVEIVLPVITSNNYEQHHHQEYHY
ncbi:sensor histidine kinase [Chitinophagaceae bacterium MMS25-I14]